MRRSEKFFLIEAGDAAERRKREEGRGEMVRGVEGEWWGLRESVMLLYIAH